MDTANAPTVYTHSGDFHVDELVAISLLEAFAFNGQPAQIIRTRHPEVLSKARDNPEVFLVDVGRSFDPGKLNFDHHQNEMTRQWPDGTPFSSCGLVWAWLREQGKLKHLDAKVIERMERDLIRPIDAHDNGKGKWPMARLFRLYNRPGASIPEVDAQFGAAMIAARALVQNQVYQVSMDVEMKTVLEQAWEEAQTWDSRGVVIVRGEAKNRTSHVILGHLSKWQANLMIYPQQTGVKNRAWYVRAVPSNSHDEAGTKALLPKKWRGMSDGYIEIGNRKVKVDFTHKAGFLARVRGNLGDAIALSMAIVEHPENKNKITRGIGSIDIKAELEEVIEFLSTVESHPAQTDFTRVARKLRTLLDHGLDPNSHSDGATLIGWCARAGFLEGVKMLHEANADIEGVAATQYQNGKSLATAHSPLMFAAANNRISCIDYLLDNGANIDQLDESGETAIYWAIDQDYPEAAEKLVQRGANLDIKDKEGDDILMHWARHAHGEATEEWQQCGRMLSMAFAASGREMPDMVVAELVAGGQAKTVHELRAIFAEKQRDTMDARTPPARGRASPLRI